MKKALSLLTATIILSSIMILFSSCSSAEDKLLGTWEYDISSGSEIYASSSYTFKKSGDEYLATLKMGSAGGSSRFSAEYSVDGNKIIFVLDNGNTITEDYSLNGSTLIIDGKEYKRK